MIPACLRIDQTTETDFLQCHIVVVRRRHY